MDGPDRMTRTFAAAVHEFDARMADEARRHLRRWLDLRAGTSLEVAVEWLLEVDLTQVFEHVRRGSGAEAMRLAVDQLRAHVEAEGHSSWKGLEQRDGTAAQVKAYLDL